eukprot:TRINITY_DN25714_c0_g4_i1.p1 TRINITY_DN25714_c0_g4~~TRINITY_DN25714_c0_g4_i1.p1  ORF type:complete len:120 (-),score=19.56 TRINITY_DN25714_c0_g4_i1:51-410(-)
MGGEGRGRGRGPGRGGRLGRFVRTHQTYEKRRPLPTARGHVEDLDDEEAWQRRRRRCAIADGEAAGSERGGWLAPPYLGCRHSAGGTMSVPRVCVRYLRKLKVHLSREAIAAMITSVET